MRTADQTAERTTNFGGAQQMQVAARPASGDPSRRAIARPRNSVDSEQYDDPIGLIPARHLGRVFHDWAPALPCATAHESERTTMAQRASPANRRAIRHRFRCVSSVTYWPSRRRRPSLEISIAVPRVDAPLNSTRGQPLRARHNDLSGRRAIGSAPDAEDAVSRCSTNAPMRAGRGRQPARKCTRHPLEPDSIVRVRPAS